MHEPPASCCGSPGLCLPRQPCDISAPLLPARAGPRDPQRATSESPALPAMPLLVPPRMAVASPMTAHPSHGGSQPVGDGCPCLAGSSLRASPPCCPLPVTVPWHSPVPGAQGLLPPTRDILTALPASLPPASQPGSPWRGAGTGARSNPRCILPRLPVPFVTGSLYSLGSSRARRQCPSTLPLAVPATRPPAAPVPVRSAPGSPRGLFLSPGHH